MCAFPTRVFTFSDDEEEEKRVVRSQKDKRYVAIQLSDSTCYGLPCLFCVCKDSMNSRLLSMP